MRALKYYAAETFGKNRCAGRDPVRLSNGRRCRIPPLFVLIDDDKYQRAVKQIVLALV